MTRDFRVKKSNCGKNAILVGCEYQTEHQEMREEVYNKRMNNELSQHLPSELGSPTTKQRSRIWAIMKRDKFLYMLALPGILFMILFKYVPMWGIIIAFQNYSPYRGVLGSDWVGLEHFIRFFQP